MARQARRVVVDSDVIVEFLRGNAVVREALDRSRARGTPLAITPIAIAEVLAGQRNGEEARTRVFLDAFDCLRIDRDVGVAAGDFLSRYARSHGVELADALVAACASVHGRLLWTHNRKHYPMPEVKSFKP